MKTKRFDDIEEIIKKSSEAYQPAFDEEAWHKMEVLLNAEKDRKPSIFWLWWLLPLIGALGAGGYFIFKNQEVKNSIVSVAAQKNKQVDIPVENKNVPSLPAAENASPRNDISADNIEKTNKPTGITSLLGSVNVVGLAVQKPLAKTTSPKKSDLQNDNSFAQNMSTVSDKVKSKTAFKVQQNNAVANEDNVTDAGKNKMQETMVIKSSEPVISQAENKTEKEKTPAVLPASAEEPAKNKTVTSPKNNNNTKLSKFYLMVDAGAETNGVKLFSSGKVTAKTGITIGYQLTEKLSVQTGFFSSSKKYVAGPADYKTKPGTYWGSVKMTKIEANCKVYEIPLAFRYDIASPKKIKIFTNIGLSSYIMKKEDYHYFYIRYGNPSQGHGSYKGNEHLFSVLKIAAGVEKNISKNFSLHAAPGLAIPIAGVGEGKVKLFSAEMLFGIKYQPLAKIKNK